MNTQDKKARHHLKVTEHTGNLTISRSSGLMTVPGGSRENWMRNLLNIYFSENPVCVWRTRGGEKANMTDENGRVDRKKEVPD